MEWQVGSMFMSASPPRVQPTQPLEIGLTGYICCQNTFRQLSVQFVMPRPRTDRFLKNLPKHVMICEIRPKYGSSM
jgi:hypothetical protein